MNTLPVIVDTSALISLVPKPTVTTPVPLS